MQGQRAGDVGRARSSKQPAEPGVAVRNAIGPQPERNQRGREPTPRVYLTAAKMPLQRSEDVRVARLNWPLRVGLVHPGRYPTRLRKLVELVRLGGVHDPIIAEAGAPRQRSGACLMGSEAYGRRDRYPGRCSAASRYALATERSVRHGCGTPCIAFRENDGMGESSVSSLVRALLRTRRTLLEDVEVASGSPERVLVRSDVSGTFQLLELVSGDLIELTSLPEPVATAEYIPGVREAVLAVDAGGNECHQLYVIDLERAATLDCDWLRSVARADE